MFSVFLSVFLIHRDIDKVEDLMSDITDQQELAQEISDAISRPVGFGEEFDEVRKSRNTNVVKPEVLPLNVIFSVFLNQKIPSSVEFQPYLSVISWKTLSYWS